MPHTAIITDYTKMNILQVRLGVSSAPPPKVAAIYCQLPLVVLLTCEPCKYQQLFIHLFSFKNPLQQLVVQ